MRRSATLEPARLAATLLLMAVAVLGWLGAQWAAVGVAEHSHLTADGLVSHHHHAYAAPMAYAAALVAVAAMAFTVLLALGHSPARRTAGRDLIAGLNRRVLTYGAAVAVVAFLVVESLELIAGSTSPRSTVLFLALGGVFQTVTIAAVMSAGAGLAAVLAGWALPQTGAKAPELARHRVAPVTASCRGGRFAWVERGRAPPVDRVTPAFRTAACPP
jgi:hypothetical protein